MNIEGLYLIPIWVYIDNMHRDFKLTTWCIWPYIACMWGEGGVSNLHPGANFLQLMQVVHIYSGTVVFCLINVVWKQEIFFSTDPNRSSCTTTLVYASLVMMPPLYMLYIYSSILSDFHTYRVFSSGGQHGLYFREQVIFFPENFRSRSAFLSRSIEMNGILKGRYSN